MVRTGSRSFVKVEPPRTHVKLHHRSGSLPCAKVRAGSVGLNHPELMSSTTTGPVPCPVLWFENVRGGSVRLNHPKLMSSSTTDRFLALVRAGSRRFGRVQPPRTHVKLTTGLVPAMVRAGSRRFVRVEPPRTHVKLHHSSVPCSGASRFEEVR